MTDSALLVLLLLESIHVKTRTTMSAAARIVSTAKMRMGWDEVDFGAGDGVGASDASRLCCVSSVSGPRSYSCSRALSSVTPCSNSGSGSGSDGVCLLLDCREFRKIPVPAEKASGTRPTAGAGLPEMTPCATQRANAGKKVAAVTMRSVRESAMDAVAI